MGRFRIQLLLEDNSWSTQYTIAKKSNYSKSPTEFRMEFVKFRFYCGKYCIKVICDEIDTAHADMCFSIITLTHSVY